MDDMSVSDLEFRAVPRTGISPSYGLPGKSIPIIVEPVVLPPPARPADVPAAPPIAPPAPNLPAEQPVGS